MEKINDLIKGHEEFKELHFRNFEVDFENLVKNGQSPEVHFIVTGKQIGRAHV